MNESDLGREHNTGATHSAAGNATAEEGIQQTVINLTSPPAFKGLQGLSVQLDDSAACGPDGCL